MAAWLAALFGFVPAPDAVLFLDVDAEASLARRADAPDPYEAGLDLGLSADVRESYRLFGERLYACFDRYAGPAGFTRIPAAGAGRGGRSTGAARRRRGPCRSERGAAAVRRVPGGRDDPHRPPVGLPFRWIAGAASRAALARRFGHRPRRPTSSS